MKLRVLRAVFAVSVIANVMVVVALGWKLSERGQWRAPEDLRRDLFHAQRPPAGSTVLLGDSLFALGEWSELMGRVVCNRGVIGDTIAKVTARLPDILANQPAEIVLLIGINDFQQGRSADVVSSDYAALVARIREQCPRARLRLVPLLCPLPEAYERVIHPQVSSFHRPERAEVEGVNAHLAMLDEVVDVTTLLADGCLAPDCTDDGLHLNAEGMRRLAVALTAH